MLKLGYKLGHYAGIMLDALTVPLCAKLCRHNVSNPIQASTSLAIKCQDLLSNFLNSKGKKYGKKQISNLDCLVLSGLSGKVRKRKPKCC